MSLVRIAVRYMAVEALKGATLVGNRVYDSQIGMVDEVSDPGTHPYLAVYTDRAVPGPDDKGVFSNGICTMLLQTSASSAMTTVDENGNSTIIDGVFATDGGFEFTLDLIARQALAALSSSVTREAELFRSLFNGFNKVERRCMGATGQGQRIASHQVLLELPLINDPVPGSAPGLLAKVMQVVEHMEGHSDPEINERARFMRAALEGPSDSWHLLVQKTGMTNASAEKLSLCPPRDS